MRYAAILLLFVSLGLGACGGGGGGGGDDLSGWYDYATRPVWPDWRTLNTVELEQAGDTLYFSGRTFLREGGTWINFAPSPVDPNRTETTMWLVAEGHLEGIDRKFVGGDENDVTEFRLLRTAVPSGTITATGTLQGHAISLTAAPAQATDGGVSGARGGLRGPGRARPPFAMILAFSQDPPLSTVILRPTGSMTGKTPSHYDETVYANPTGGSVPITLWETGRVRGTFDLTFPGGDAVTGAFDVLISIHATP